MKIVLMCIGDELLNGRTQEKNLIFLGKFLRRQGLDLDSAQILRDKESILLERIKDVFDSYDVVILSGGLGPTEDDLTKNILAKCFHSKLIKNEKVAEIVRENYKRRNLSWDEKLNSYDYFPEGFEPLSNSQGLAPAVLYVDNNKKKVLLAAPGVPREFEAIIQDHFLNSLTRISKARNKINFSLAIRTKGIPEEKIFNQLCPDLWQDLTHFGKVQSLPHRAGVDIIVNKEMEFGMEQNFIDKVKEFISKSKLAPYIWYLGDDSLEKVIIDKLIKIKKTVALAESCTGGLISSHLTDVQGASKVLSGSIVCYSNEIKINELKVDPDLIEKETSISSAVAEFLAKNILEKFKSDISLSITGQAGPINPSDRIPVGTVFVAIADKLSCEVHSGQFSGDRAYLKNRFTQFALSLLFDRLHKIEQANSDK